MSADLETLLRDAADHGPSPDLDVADLRRRARRRNARRGSVAAVGVVAVAAVVVVTAAGPRAVPSPSVAGSPDGDGLDVAEVIPVEPTPAHLELRPEGDVGGCTLLVVLDPPGRVAVVNLDDEGRDGADVVAACTDPSHANDTPFPFVEATVLDHPRHGDARIGLGLVDARTAEVAVTFDDGRVALLAVDAPAGEVGTAHHRYGFVVPAGRSVVEVVGRDADDEVVFVHEPADDDLTVRTPAHDAGDPVPPEPEGTRGTTAEPLDDVAVELPAEVEPFGTWRPVASPVDLSPLSSRHTDDWWFVNDDPDAPAYPVAREVVADRLGDEAQLGELCTFLEGEHARAVAEVDIDAEDPVAAETLVYLVLGQEEVVAGDAVTATVTHVCGLPSQF